MKTLIEELDEENAIMPLEDGFMYFWPSSKGEALSAYNLRLIADELDRRNEEWQARIDEYFLEEQWKQDQLDHERRIAEEELWNEENS